jgi:uncharacterized protein
LATTPNGRLAVRWVPDIRHIDPAAWRAIAAGRPFYVGWEWLRGFADTLSPVVVVEDDAGLILGALPCFAAPSVAQNPRYSLFDLFGGKGWGPSRRADWLPQLVGGSGAGYAGAVLVRGELAPYQATDVVAALMREFAELAAGTGCQSAALLYLDHHDAGLVSAALGDQCSPLLTSASAWLPVTWADFAGYVGSLRASRRSVVGRDVRAFDRSECRVERGRLAPQIGLLAPLLANVQNRHGQPATVDSVAYYLAKCSANGLDDLSVVFVAKRGQEPVAFALGYEVDGALEMRVAGLDYTRIGEHAEYFTVLFYEPIRYAAERGLSRIEYGVEAFRAKLLRGCRLRPLWSVVTACPDGPAGRGSVREWNEQAYRHWQQACAPLAGELAVAEWTFG